MARVIQPWIRTFLFALACIGAAFATKFHYLHKGLFEDDFGFVHHGRLSFHLAETAFNPVTIHWFYRPLFFVWFSIFNTFTPGNAVVLHAANLVLFGITVFLTGSLVERLTGSCVAGFFSSLLFLIAPNMDEAIWWISSGSTLGAANFSLLAIHTWLSWRGTGQRRYYVFALIAMASAMCNKEDAATLPFIMLTLDVYLLRGNRNWRVKWMRSAVPVLTWTLIYIGLDLTAYHYVNVATNYGTTNLWHSHDRSRLQMVVRLGLNAVIFNHFGSPAALLEIPPSVLFAGIFGYLAIQVRRVPLLAALLAIAVLGFLPVPLATGGHSFSTRFGYVPNMYGTIFAGVMVYLLLTSKNRFLWFSGIILTWNMLRAHEAISSDRSIEPALQWLVIALMCIPCYFVARRWPVTIAECLLVGVLSLATAIFDSMSMDLARLIFAALAGGIYGYRYRGTMIGIVTAIALVSSGPLIFAVALAASAIAIHRARYVDVEPPASKEAAF